MRESDLNDKRDTRPRTNKRPTMKRNKQTFLSIFAARMRERGSINIIAALEWLVVVLLIVLFVVPLIMVLFFSRGTGYRMEDPAPGYPFRPDVTGPVIDESTGPMKENAGTGRNVEPVEQVAP